jgi:hypothetical protein
MTLRNFRISALVAALALAGASSLHAATVEIQFTGLDLIYGNGDLDLGLEIHDATSPIGGTGVPAVSDPLTNVNFFVDGSLVGTLTADVFADVFIDSVNSIPAGGGVVTSGGNNDSFGFDILTENGLPGWGLALNIDEIQVFYSGFEITIAGAGLAASVPAQDLPFGLVIDDNDPISIVFSSTNLTNVTSAGGFLTGFNASGTGSISGTLVPEPSSIALAGFGLIGLVAAWRKRRSTK